MKKPNDFPPPKYPGTPQAMDGTAAAVEMETAGSEAAGVYPITPATQMGEGWAAAVANGKPNVFGRRLLFFEPEGEHAAAAVTAGMSLTGLRSANFSAGQGIAYMHESLYAAVGKRLTYVLHMACRAITKQALNIHCGHDDYHAVDDTGFFQLFAKNVQEVADFTLIAHRIAELSLNPGVCAQDGFLTSHVIETLRLPERELVAEYLGDPGDTIESPTPAQRMMFGDRRRRVPELFDLDHPAMLGVVQNQDAYAQGVAAQRPFFFDHVRDLADRAFDEYAALTGRRYARATGYRSEDASYLVIGQGSVVYNLEEVCDHLRSVEGIDVGVVNMTMFRPFPDDLVAALLRGKRAAVVLERVDQPLAGDPPLLREIRGSVLKGLENGRAGDAPAPYPGLPAIAADEAPRLHSACYGLGSRDIQPGDLIAAIKNMLPDGARRSRFYLGVDFLRGRSGAAAVTRHQEALRQSYPGLEEIELAPEENVNLLPDDSVALRIHSVGGWGAITMGKNLALTLSDLIGLNVKANPKYGSEKKGQPTTFYAVLSRKPLRLNCDLKYVNVVLSPDPNVFRHSNALAGLAEGGVFVIQSEQSAEALWNGLPPWARDTIRERKIEVFHLDAFGIARAEASEVELQYRMQGAAFQGALFAASPLMKREQLTEDALFEAIRSQLQKKFGHRGERIVEDNYRVIRRGFTEVCRLDWAALCVESGAPATTDAALRLPVVTPGEPGVGDPRRFFDQVCALYQSGQDPIADPFAALSAMPIATGVFRDMTGIRFEVPQLVAERCTGCGQCWTQCPDTAIPGLVSEIDQLLLTAASAAGDDGDACKQLPGIVSPLAEETRRVLKEVPETEFVDALDMAYRRVADRLELEPAQRKALDEELKAVSARLADFHLAKTAPFFDVPERETEGSGGLLSITVNPFACKGCNLCVEVCPDNALLTVKQDESIVEQLRDNWAFWQRLPDTPDRFVQIRDLDEGIGVLHTMLLKKANYHAMVGGDGACMGCGEKTVIHLVVATIEAALQPHVSRFVARLNELISRLEAKVRLLLAADADLEHLPADGQVALAVSEEQRGQVAHLTELLRRLKDLCWRYTTGPSGRGRSSLGMTNSTGCSSVWASTYPFNPYPFPWVNHLFQDAPSIAIGIFEGQARKMADAFATVRRVELELEDAYDPAVHDALFEAFDWRAFTEEEHRLCPPIVSVGGDGAMYDIGFQNLSRLLMSGMPIRVVVLDTQVYSNTGGQACTSGFLGQVSDMAEYGAAQHGKLEQRKELSLLSLAHRGAFVLQSSQASPAHLIGGLLKGLASRRPAVFNLYSPCQTEHGITDDASASAARLALESRVFPFLVYDPDAGPALADRLDLDGNPVPEDNWPTHSLAYRAEDGTEKVLTVPLTTADWAATETRFAKHFTTVGSAHADMEMVPYHEYLLLDLKDREGKRAFIHALSKDGRLCRLLVSEEMVQLGEDRQAYWSELREMAGDAVSEGIRDDLSAEMEHEFEERLSALRAEHEASVQELKRTYPRLVARRMAEALLGPQDALARLTGSIGSVPAATAPLEAGTVEVPAATVPEVPAAVREPTGTGTGNGDGLELGPWIDKPTCTSCDECIKVNPKLFVYDADKKATITDPKLGSYKDLVTAAERCASKSIRPGAPLNPRERNVDKWIARAAPFNT